MCHRRDKQNSALPSSALPLSPSPPASREEFEVSIRNRRTDFGFVLISRYNSVGTSTLPLLSFFLSCSVGRFSGVFVLSSVTSNPSRRLRPILVFRRLAGSEPTVPVCYFESSRCCYSHPLPLLTSAHLRFFTMHGWLFGFSLSRHFFL